MLSRSHRLNHFRHWRISFPGIKNGSLEKSSENCYNIPQDCSDRRLRPRRWDIPHDAIAHQKVNKKFSGIREKCGGSQGVAPPLPASPFWGEKGITSLIAFLNINKKMDNNMFSPKPKSRTCAGDSCLQIILIIPVAGSVSGKSGILCCISSFSAGGGLKG